MRRACLLPLLLLPTLAGADDVVLHPHGSEGDLYKGQLHSHSSETDGAQSPRDLFRAYGEAGYDFVCLTDHLTLTQDPEVEGVTWIPASEIHTKAAEVGDTWGGHHINALGLQTPPRNGWDRSSPEAVLARIAREGGLAMANHPRLRNHWSAELLATARPLQLLSIFNTKGYYTANKKLQGSGSLLYATQFQWDRLLGEGRVLWGVAADDCHDVTDPDQFDMGWVRVRAASASAGDLLQGLRRGDLYACRGAGGVAPELRVWTERDAEGRWQAFARSDTPETTLRWMAAGALVAEGPGPLLVVRDVLDHATLRAEAHGERDHVTYSQPLTVVRGATIAVTQQEGRWRLQLRDAQQRPVAIYRELPILVGGARVVVIHAGLTGVVLPEGVASGEAVTPDPARGWPATRLP